MKRSEGFVLIVTLLIMVVVGIFALGASYTSLLDRQVSANQRGASSAYYVADAGIQYYKTWSFRNMEKYYSDPNHDRCARPLETGIGTGTFPHGLIPGNPIENSPWIDFGPGRFRVRFDLIDTFLVLTSEGRVGSSQATLQLVAASGLGPSDAWDNAIFAGGENPSNQTIAGNVSVYGSIHLVKGTLIATDDALVVTGTTGVYNRYNGENVSNTDISALMGEITGSPNSTIDLCSRVKVATGSIRLNSGSSRLGHNSGVDKDKLYSLHLGNGNVYDQANKIITDHHSTSLVNLQYPAGAGINSGYEGWVVNLPRPKLQYPNEVTVDEGGYLSVPHMLTLTGQPYPDNPSELIDCTWLIQGGNVTLPPLAPSTSRTCRNGVHRIEWRPVDGATPAHLFISGIVNVSDKALDVTYNVNISEMRYQGRGILRTGICDSGSEGKCSQAGFRQTDATITISGDLLPVDSGISLQRRGFPKHNMLALITTGDAWIGASTAQRKIAALVFAGDTVTVDKQTIIAGSLIADKFDIKQQVPKVAYHPDIRDAVRDPSYCFGLIGSICYEFDSDNPLEDISFNPGVLSNISVERR